MICLDCHHGRIISFDCEHRRCLRCASSSACHGCRHAVFEWWIGAIVMTAMCVVVIAATATIVAVAR